MKLKRSTIIWLAIALGLGSFIYWSEIKGNSSYNLESRQRPLFNFSSTDIETLTITTEDKTLQFVATNSQATTWKIEKPYSVNANNASVLFLVNLLVSTTIERQFPVEDVSLAEYGLDEPTGQIIIQLRGGEVYQLQLGQTNFDNNFIYAQTDTQEILLLPISFKYALERDLAEWQSTVDE